MRLLKTNPAIESEIETQTINGIEHDVILYFELKNDKNVFLKIPWSLVRGLSYIDDIFNVGLKGEIIIENNSGILDKILNNTDQFYLGFYIYNSQTRFEENIYFSIISTSAIESTRSSSGCQYRLSIQESFMVEGANRNLRSMGLAIKSSNTSVAEKALERVTDLLGITVSNPNNNSKTTSKNIHDLLQYARDIIASDLRINATPENINEGANVDFSFSDLYLVASQASSRVIDLDNHSLEYFKKNYPTDLIGEAIFKDIGQQESALGLLEKINSNVFFPRAVGKDSAGRTSHVSFTIGDAGTARSENISYIRTNNKTIYNGDDVYGQRCITLRNFKDTFTACFQDNNLYEILMSVDGSDSIPNRLNPSFISPTFFYNVKLYPVNVAFTNIEWCDYIVSPINQPDVFSGVLYRFNDIVSLFNKEYLHDKTTSNILLSPVDSRGIAAKVPPFNENTLNFAATSKTIRTFFTLNNMVQVSLPGNTFRKANEILYIDKNIMISDTHSSENTQSTFSNTFESNYFFITRVTHNFKGQKYDNELFLSSFCKPFSTDQK